MKRIRDQPVPDTGRPDVPASLERLLKAGMAKDPGLRPASAMDFARSLQVIEQELRLPRTEIVPCHFSSEANQVGALYACLHTVGRMD